MVALEPYDGTLEGVDNGFRFSVQALEGSIDTPFLLESSRYRVLIAKAPEAPEGITILAGGLPLSMWAEGSLLIGTIATGRAFGVLQLRATLGPHALAQVEVEVRPRYLDLEEDYTTIKADLDRVSFSLAYSVWKRAHAQGFPDFTVPGGTPEWLAMLRHSWSRIKVALSEIDKNPNSTLIHARDVRRADQVRSIDAISQRWLARHPGAWYASRDEPRVASVSVGDSYVTPQQVLSARRIVTIDTPANRALKFVLSRLENRIRSVLRQIDDLPQKHFAGGEKGEYAAQLHQVLRDSQRYTVHGFLREVGAYPITPSAVHVVRADPRYRQAFRALSILNWGIFSRLEGPVAELALKDTWELYEYWVYLFVLDYFVSAGWECIAQGVISAAHPGSPIVIDLARGKDSESQFETVDPGVGTPKTATVAFHRVFPSRRQNTALGRGALTVERDVDILIEVESGGGLKRAVLDPKYRVEQDNGCLTCQVSAINDMHVYRDAVGRWEMAANGERYFVRTLDAAVAVFPSRDDECTATSLYTESLRDGIGALPLLPPDDEPPQLFYAFLEDLLS